MSPTLPGSRTPRRQLRPPPASLIKALYAIGLGPVVGRFILLLTTIGRKSGLPRITPLQYEEIAGQIYIGSARGPQADWFRNIVANPRVHIRVKSREFNGIAQPVTDVARIADFLELRLERHPRMVGAILASEGLPRKPSRADIEEYARRLAMVIVRPA